jgi:acyl-homoserine-lactone acylase
MAQPALARSASHAGHGGGLVALIRRTTGGTPHILAKNWTDLGFGYGFAFAQDNICTMANDYVTVEAQRSRYFGPDATNLQRATSVEVTNLDSDLFFQQIIDSGVIARLTRGLDLRVLQIEEGYVQGYNHYLASVGGAKGISDPTCRGQAWVKPITLADSFLRFYQLMLTNSEGALIQGIAEAAPPATPPSTTRNTPQARSMTLPGQAAAIRDLAARWGKTFTTSGSNAVAIGSAGTRNHRGLLLGNPHFPWIGPERMYQAQLTIPGQINVTGASLYGVPLVLIGHNTNVAWSHTVSTAVRFTPYQLAIVPSHPTEYLENGRPVAMTSRPVTVTVREPAGKLGLVTRMLYSTRYGPVFNNLLGVSVPWTTSSAFTVRDANAPNLSRALNTWFGFDEASNADQVLAILKRFQGIPWVNTIASDRNGTALYADIGSVPGVSNALAAKCDTPFGAQTFANLGLPILDGSRTACDWQTGLHAAAPGLLGPGQEPFLRRSDFVTNSNDSFWLSNPHQPLTGFNRIIGDEGTARSLRTRIGLIEVQTRINGTDGLGPKGFTLAALRNLDLNDLDYAAVLTKNALVQLCQTLKAHGGVAPTSTGTTVPIGNACTVLAHWNNHWDPGQSGAVLFGLFWNEAGAGAPFSHPFRLANPVGTPFGLNTASKLVRTSLGDAIGTLDAAQLPLNIPLGAAQFVTYRGQHIPIPGGPGVDGVYNAISVDSEAGDSLTAPDDGSSFIQVVTWNNSSCPVGATILTYSESSNPDSPHFADQTKLFSRKQLLTDRFCQAQIMADPHLVVTMVKS